MPHLDSLLGLLTFLCCPTAVLCGPASMVLCKRAAAVPPEVLPDVPSERGLSDGVASALPKSAVIALIVEKAERHRLLFASGVLLGLVFVFSILPETIYSITTVGFGGGYWCKDVGE